MAGASAGEPQVGPQRVAVVIPCHNARATIASTVRACRAIPSVDLIVVVDDGSNDDTAQVARSAGAVAVRHSVVRGRASAMETGVKVAAMRDRADWPARHILFLEQDLGDSAVEASALVEAVKGGVADCAIAVVNRLEGRRFSGSAGLAWKGIRLGTGWISHDPLSTQRCLTREALTAVMPFSSGWGVDVGITIDLLVEGFSAVEVPCDLHSSRLEGARSIGVRLARYRDVWIAVRTRRFLRQRVPLQLRLPAAQQSLGSPYQPLKENP